MPGKPEIASRRPRSAQARGIESLVHADVEIRTGTSGCYRGTLERFDSEFLYLLKTNGRGVVIARSAVVAITEERSTLPGIGGT